jgi:hypothetical protein
MSVAKLSGTADPHYRRLRVTVMSLTSTMPDTRWKWALLLGATLGLVSTLANTSAYFRLAYSLRYLADPGLFLDALITIEGLGVGESPLETWLLIIPVNVAFYTLLFYVVIAGISTLNPKIVIAMGLILAIIVAAILAPRIQKHNHYATLYSSLKQGTGRAGLLQQWGPPSFLGTCQSFVKWDGNPIPPGTKSCVEELWYSSPITSDVWGIGFDEDGHAISKYHRIW